MYFAEGIQLGIVVVILPFYFLDKGISVEITTIVAGVSLIPWLIKFLWSSIIDKYSIISKKLFILIGGILGAVCFFILYFIDPVVSLIPFTIFFFLSHVFISFFDSAADIWAIEISLENERGKIFGAMQSGMYIGSGFATVTFSSIAKIYGYPIIFPVAGIIILLAILFPLFIKEEKSSPKEKKVISVLLKEFKNKVIQKISIYASLIAISSGILTISIPLYLRNSLNLDVSQVGFMAALVPLMIAPGNIIGGIMADKIGRKKSIFIFIGINIIFSILLIFSFNWWLVIIIFGTVLFMGGGLASAQGAMLMDLTNPKVGATQFSLFSGFLGIGDVGGRMIAGFLIVLLGFGNLFIFSGLILILPLLILLTIQYKK